MLAEANNLYALLRRPQVEAMTGLKRSSIYALMRRGEFPRPTKLTARAVGWPRLAVEAWIRDRMGEDVAQHDGATKPAS
jgi:prophage regulatory protein